MPRPRGTTSAPASTSSREGPTALLVEGEDPVRALLRRILESAGYEVLEARDAGDALSVLWRFPRSVDLLLAEQSESGIVGPGGLRERIPRGAKVFLTYRAGSDAFAAGLEDGTTFFVANPFRNDALSTKLRELRKK